MIKDTKETRPAGRFSKFLYALNYINSLIDTNIKPYLSGYVEGVDNRDKDLLGEMKTDQSDIEDY